MRAGIPRAAGEPRVVSAALVETQVSRPRAQVVGPVGDCRGAHQGARRVVRPEEDREALPGGREAPEGALVGLVAAAQEGADQADPAEVVRMGQEALAATRMVLEAPAQGAAGLREIQEAVVRGTQTSVGQREAPAGIGVARTHRWPG